VRDKGSESQISGEQTTAFAAVRYPIVARARTIGHAVIGQGYRVIYREAHILLEQVAEAFIDGTRKEHMEHLPAVPLLIVDDLAMRKLGPTAGEELLGNMMCYHERAGTVEG